jgi:uncharacterized protein
VTNVSDASALSSRDVPGGCEFSVLVSAGSSRSGVRGLHGDALKLAVRSAPEKGRANDEVESVLAEFLGLPRKQVSVVSGHTSRRKRVQAMGCSSAHVKAVIAPT